MFVDPHRSNDGVCKVGKCESIGQQGEGVVGMQTWEVQPRRGVESAGREGGSPAESL